MLFRSHGLCVPNDAQSCPQKSSFEAIFGRRLSYTWRSAHVKMFYQILWRTNVKDNLHIHCPGLIPKHNKPPGEDKSGSNFPFVVFPLDRNIDPKDRNLKIGGHRRVWWIKRATVTLNLGGDL